MNNIASNIFVVAGIILGSLTATANATGSAMLVAGKASAPIGHVEFCGANPVECGGYDRPSQVVRLNADIWNRLLAVNTAINAAVLPATDMEIYGVVERWSYPGIEGDCEDYVLEKRRSLVADGWPASALLITVVRDEKNEGHAVLTVRTDRGDLILDNKTDTVLAWNQTPYTFIKRQSARNAGAWDMIEDARSAAVSSLGSN